MELRRLVKIGLIVIALCIPGIIMNAMKLTRSKTAKPAKPPMRVIKTVPDIPDGQAAVYRQIIIIR